MSDIAYQLLHAALPSLALPCCRVLYKCAVQSDKSVWLDSDCVLQALLPEKRYLFYPNLAKAAGSQPLAQRLRALQPDVNIFGHTHFSWDDNIEGLQSGCLCKLM